MKTKKDIVKDISEIVGLTQVDTKRVVQMTFDAIIETLVHEGRIELRNFGVFEVKIHKARVGRNPKSPAATIRIPPKAVATFKAGKEMRETVLQLHCEYEG